MNYWSAFLENAQKIGIRLDDDELSLFVRYTELLLKNNKKFNLTAIKTIPDILTKHYLDSLAMLPVIARTQHISPDELRHRAWSVIDIGSGGGIPGYPLHFVWPTMHLTLVEATQKKAAFLQQVCQQLHLDVTVLAERTETLGQNSQYRNQYQLVVARAVAPLNILIEYTLPFVRLDGWVALPKGPQVREELAAAQAGIHLLGGTVISCEDIIVPGLAEKRSLLLLRKTHPTPQQYPRRPGIPAKRPLSPTGLSRHSTSQTTI